MAVHKVSWFAQTPLQTFNNHQIISDIPPEIILRWLHYLNLASLLCFSMASRSCNILTLSFLQDKYTQQLAYGTLKLELNLGKLICCEIMKLPYWNRGMQFSKADEVDITQFKIELENDGENHFFRSLIAGELYLILIEKHRLTSRVIQFNSKFEAAKDEDQMLFWEWSRSIMTDASHPYQIQSTPYLIEKYSNINGCGFENNGWEYLKERLEQLMGFKNSDEVKLLKIRQEAYL